MTEPVSKVERSFAWFKIIALAWLVLISFSQLRRIAPASWWFDVDEFSVADGFVGEPVPLTYKREVKKPFNVDITAYVWKVDGGKYVEYCSTYRRDRFLAGRELPPVPTVQWMLRPTTCNLEEGHYVLSVTWSVKVDSVTSKDVTRETNIFTIIPKP